MLLSYPCVMPEGEGEHGGERHETGSRGYAQPTQPKKDSFRGGGEGKREKEPRATTIISISSGIAEASGPEEKKDRVGGERPSQKKGGGRGGEDVILVTTD